jgi:hypothetical protein
MATVPNNPSPNFNFLTLDQNSLINRLVEDLDHDSRKAYDQLTPHEQEFVIRTLLDTLRGDSDRYKLLWELDFVRKPVSIQDFIEDKDYFGSTGKGLFPVWRRELEVLFDTDNQINEVVVTGAIGTGKTTLAIVGLAYRLYWLTCLRNPFEYFNLMEGTSSFTFALFNTTRELNDKVQAAKVLGAFNLSPYFRWLTSGSTEENEKEKDVLKFPNNIKFAFGSRGVHALGQDVIGGLLDEMNFQSVSENTNQAKEMYRQTKRRIVSRFPARPGRKSPGLLFLVSSRKGEEDFLDDHIREIAKVGGDPTVRVVSYSSWEAKCNTPNSPYQGRIENGIYTGPTFRVIVGDDRFRSRILEEGESEPEDYRIVHVPVEHRPDFELDPEGSLMDLAGVSIKGGGRPLLHRERLYECIEYDKEYYPRSHPFISDIVSIGLRTSNFIEDSFDWTKILECIDPYKKIYAPKINPTAHRYIHLDPATSGDCLYGFAMGHVAGRTHVKRRDPITMTEHDIQSVVIYIDLMLGLTHPPGDEIDLSRVRSFVMFLRKMGFPISTVTSDQYQSTDTLQTFKKLGYNSKNISLDSKPENYGMFRQCIHEGRLLLYEYKPFIDEAIWLQVETADMKMSSNKGRPKIGRVFHLEGRHKDLSDAVAGVVASIMMDEKSEDSAVYPISPETQNEYRPQGAIDVDGSWLLDTIPGIDKITGILNG